MSQIIINTLSVYISAARQWYWHILHAVLDDAFPQKIQEAENCTYPF